MRNHDYAWRTGLVGGLVVALLSLTWLAWAAPKPLVLPSIALSAGSDLQLGGWVLFDTTVPKAYERQGPRVQVICYQDGALVYGEAGPASQAFLLGGASSAWLVAGGAAHCVADLYVWTYRGGQTFTWLASTEFDAAG